ncbi:MAG TPA: hypothetical protein VFP64_10665 [Pyrinomonadaceae bacterium]|nr:hypothetical protein [Pyrinomonadaceae bacterium]
MRRYLVELRSILLAFAIFDFITIWMMASKIRFTCTVGPWYHPWNYLIGPTILLVSSLFLCANRWWSNTIALLASGSFIGYFVYILLIGDPVTSLPNTWRINGIYYPDLVIVQYLFALTVFCYSALSLKRNFLSQKLTAPAG